VPTLAIHLTNDAEKTSFTPDKETHIKPIFSNIVYEQLAGLNFPEKEGLLKENHFAGLLEAVSKQLG